MRRVVSCGSTAFPWLVFIFGALLWGSTWWLRDAWYELIVSRTLYMSRHSDNQKTVSGRPSQFTWLSGSDCRLDVVRTVCHDFMLQCVLGVRIYSHKQWATSCRHNHLYTVILVVTFSRGFLEIARSFILRLCFFVVVKWRLARAHCFHSLCLHQSTVAQRAETIIAKSSRLWPNLTSCVWARFRIGSHTMPGQRHSQPTPTALVQGCMRV